MSHHNPPPKRGLIMVKIFKSFARSAAEIVSLAKQPKGEKNPESLDSVSAIPHETPSGFDSDSESDEMIPS